MTIHNMWLMRRYSEGTCGGCTKMAEKIGGSYFQIPSKMFNVLEKIKIGNSNLGKIINEKRLDGVNRIRCKNFIKF